MHDGSFGERGSGDGQLRIPAGAAVAPGGDILVADSSNNRVQRFDAGGAYKSQFNVTTADGRSVPPRGLAMGSDGSIYVASIQADAILKFSSNGSLVQSLDASGRFRAPTGLDIGPDGLLYAVDAGAGVVRVLDADDGSFAARRRRAGAAGPIPAARVALGP